MLKPLHLAATACLVLCGLMVLSRGLQSNGFDNMGRISVLLREHDQLLERYIALQQEHDRREREEEWQLQDQRARFALQHMADSRQHHLHTSLDTRFREMAHAQDRHKLRALEPLYHHQQQQQQQQQQRRNDTVVMVSGCDKGTIQRNRARFDERMANRNRYADRHGYRHVFLPTDGDDEHGHEHEHGWGKVAALREAMAMAMAAHHDVGWFWWLDMDLHVANHSVDLSSLVLDPQALAERLAYGRPMRDEKHRFSMQYFDHVTQLHNVDLILSHSYTQGWDTRSMLVRNSAFGAWVLDMWGDHAFREYLGSSSMPSNESTVLAYLISRHSTVRDHVGYIPEGLITPGLHNFVN